MTSAYGSTRSFAATISRTTLKTAATFRMAASFHTDPGFPGGKCDHGHNATVHGCSIGANSLVEIGATILNGASVGAFCLVAAGTLIRENMLVPNRSLASYEEAPRKTQPSKATSRSRRILRPVRSRPFNAVSVTPARSECRVARSVTGAGDGSLRHRSGCSVG